MGRAERRQRADGWLPLGEVAILNADAGHPDAERRGKLNVGTALSACHQPTSAVMALPRAGVNQGRPATVFKLTNA